MTKETYEAPVMEVIEINENTIVTSPKCPPYYEGEEIPIL